MINSRIAQLIKISTFILKVLFINSSSPFPIATAIKRLLVDNIIVLKTPIKDIMLPRTENNPKSATPRAFKAKRVVRSAKTVLIPILAYIIIELSAIALLVFSCIKY